MSRMQLPGWNQIMTTKDSRRIVCAASLRCAVGNHRNQGGECKIPFACLTAMNYIPDSI